MIRLPKSLDSIMSPLIEKNRKEWYMTTEERIESIKKKKNLNHGGTKQNKKKRRKRK